MRIENILIFSDQVGGIDPNSKKYAYLNMHVHATATAAFRFVEYLCYHSNDLKPFNAAFPSNSKTMESETSNFSITNWFPSRDDPIPIFLRLLWNEKLIISF